MRTFEVSADMRSLLLAKSVALNTFRRQLRRALLRQVSPARHALQGAHATNIWPLQKHVIASRPLCFRSSRPLPQTGDLILQLFQKSSGLLLRRLEPLPGQPPETCRDPSSPRRGEGRDRLPAKSIHRRTSDQLLSKPRDRPNLRRGYSLQLDKARPFQPLRRNLRQSFHHSVRLQRARPFHPARQRPRADRLRLRRFLLAPASCDRVPE